MRLAYQLAVRNKIKIRFCRRNEKAGRKWLKIFLRRHLQISVRTPEGLSLSRARGFAPESVVHGYQNCTAQTHENICLERQASDNFSSIRRTGIRCDSRHIYESNWTLHSSVTCISKKKYERRTDEWLTARIKARVPFLGVDRERDFFPVLSSFHQTHKADKRRSCYLSTGWALFTNQEPEGHYFSSRELC